MHQNRCHKSWQARSVIPGVQQHHFLRMRHQLFRMGTAVSPSHLKHQYKRLWHRCHRCLITCPNNFLKLHYLTPIIAFRNIYGCRCTVLHSHEYYFCSWCCCVEYFHITYDSDQSTIVVFIVVFIVAKHCLRILQSQKQDVNVPSCIFFPTIIICSNLTLIYPLAYFALNRFMSTPLLNLQWQTLGLVCIKML